MRPRCLVILGPTASGKSSLAMRLCREIGGGIVSADSMQIYKRMDIGTAKPSAADRALVPHRMIDLIEPGAPFSAYDYKAQAESAISDFVKNELVPVVVGGTGLYLDALLFNTQFGEMDTKPEIRENLIVRSQTEGNLALLEELSRVDPAVASRLHEKDTKRILRALEVYYTTGKTLTQFQKESRLTPPPFDFLLFSLQYRDRKNLYDRIDRRVDEMMAAGLLEETRRLYEAGDLKNSTAGLAIGYKELIPYLLGEKTLAECTAYLKQKTRNYAKRQITWFKRYTDAVPLVMDLGSDPGERLLSEAKNFLGKETI